MVLFEEEFERGEDSGGKASRELLGLTQIQIMSGIPILETKGCGEKMQTKCEHVLCNYKTKYFLLKSQH